MSSVVEICNLALSNIRGGSINSIDEASVQAQQCKLKYGPMRDMVLKDAPWGFANKILPLALLSGVDIFNWNYAYQYPADCFYVNNLILNIEANVLGDGVSRPRYLEDLNPTDLEQQVKYKVLNNNNVRIIVSNEPDIRADYRSKVTDTNLFDPTFIMALSWLLAAELSIPVVGGETGRALRADAFKVYESYLNAATADDLNEGHTIRSESDFIEVRQ